MKRQNLKRVLEVEDQLNKYEKLYKALDDEDMLYVTIGKFASGKVIDSDDDLCKGLDGYERLMSEYIVRFKQLVLEKTNDLIEEIEAL